MVLVATKEVDVVKFESPGGKETGGSVAGGGAGYCPCEKAPEVTGAWGNWATSGSG